MKTAISLTAAAFGLAIFNISAATRYVWQDNPSPRRPTPRTDLRRRRLAGRRGRGAGG